MGSKTQHFTPGGGVKDMLIMLRHTVPTVKMETLCSKFYAVISGTSGDIDVGSSGECLESKN